MVELMGHARRSVMPRHQSVAEVRANITARIAAREPGWRPGEKIPTHDELVKLLPASKSTVTRAIRSLKADGILDGLRGGGVYVAEDVTLPADAKDQAD